MQTSESFHYVQGYVLIYLSSVRWFKQAARRRSKKWTTWIFRGSWPTWVFRCVFHMSSLYLWMVLLATIWFECWTAKDCRLINHEKYCWNCGLVTGAPGFLGQNGQPGLSRFIAIFFLSRNYTAHEFRTTRYHEFGMLQSCILIWVSAHRATRTSRANKVPGRVDIPW